MTGAFDTEWERVHAEREWGRYPSEDVIRFVARNFYSADRGSTRLLDMGCGTGAVLWFVAREGFDAHGFDGSDSAVERARARLAAEGLRATVSVADAIDIPYPDDHFDGLIDSGMLTSNGPASVRGILRDCCRVLRPGGRMLSTMLFTPSTTGFGTGERLGPRTFRNLDTGPIANIGTIHFFTSDEVLTAYREAGFHVDSMDVVRRTQSSGDSIVEYFIVEATK